MIAAGLQGPVRHEYEVSVCILDEDKPETVTAVCEESFPGAEVQVMEVWADRGGIKDIFDTLDHVTRDYISELCNRQQERIEWGRV